MNDLSATIEPKSDQLNADDLISGPVTLTINNVLVCDSPDQPVIVDVGNGYRPYKPCKSMRRIMIAVWGKHDTDWIGKSMTLYCDPTVRWAGKEVGGIRISHMSGISKPYSMPLTATRGQRKPYTVQPLTLPQYPQSDYEKNKGAWLEAIQTGKLTPEKIIQGCQKKGLLTEAQKQEINNMANQPGQTEQDEDM